MKPRLRSCKLVLIKMQAYFGTVSRYRWKNLKKRFAEQAQAGKNPSIQLRADKEGKYDTVAQVLTTASEAGLTKIAFVSE